jgi:hypothetical protein
MTPRTTFVFRDTVAEIPELYSGSSLVPLQRARLRLSKRHFVFVVARQVNAVFETFIVNKNAPVLELIVTKNSGV